MGGLEDFLSGCGCCCVVLGDFGWFSMVLSAFECLRVLSSGFDWF